MGAKKFKEKLSYKELFNDFVTSLKRHEVPKLRELSLSSNNLLVIRQVCKGDRIKGLGYDRSVNEWSLWLRVDQGNYSVKNEFWNENSVFELCDNLKDVTIMKAGNKAHITLSELHPVSCLARLLHKSNEVFLPGEYNGWDRENNPFNPIWDGNTLTLVLDLGDANKLGECKIAIKNVIKCEWRDSGWADGAEQTLKIQL